MAEYTWSNFQKDCLELGISLTEYQMTQFQNYYQLLNEWNTFMNLTAITDLEGVLKKHFLDSLAVVKTVDIKSVTSVMDIGSGAGFPGIPLKIVFPHVKMVLLDSLGKRIKFLNHVIDCLELQKITAVHGRAEDFAQNADYRERFDLVLSRAVANLSALSEYCIPYTILNGMFISYKSGHIEEELCSSKNAISILGGKIKQVYKFTLSDMGERSLVVISKIKATPKKYPRKAGTPSREPL